MKRTPHVACAALLIGVIGTRGADVEGSRTGDADGRNNSPILAPPESKPTPAPRPRTMSGAIAAQLAAAAPSFKPPEAKPAPTPAVEVPEEKPRNTIIRLPRYIVEGERPPVFKSRDLLTPPAKVALGFKRYPGLHVGSLPFLSNAGWAREMIEEDLTLERKREMADLTSLLPTGPAQDKQVKEAAQQMASQTKTWAETGGSYQEQKR